MPDPSSFCFVHVADLHLDTPFHGLSATAPAVAESLRDASLAAFDAVVSLSLDRQAAFLAVAGDVYDGPERGLRAQLRVRDGLARLGTAGIATFVVHGNHDPLESGWSAITAWPPGTTIFPTAPPSGGPAPVHEVARDGRVIATVQGVSYATARTTENLALRLSRPGGSARRGVVEPLHVGLLHCNVAGAPGGHADYSPCSLADLRATRLDYLALGHVHQRSVLAEGSGPGDPWVVYPGNTQAHSWRAGEQGAKGAYVVHVEGGRVARLEFVACDQVRFDELDCPIGDLGDLGALADRLGRFADEAAGRAGDRLVVLRARLVGSGELHGELARAGVLEELLAHLRDEALSSRPARWWDSIRDASGSPLDPAELAGRGDFASDLLELTRSLLGDDEAASSFATAALSGLPRALAQRAGELLADPARRGELIGRAARRALDELVLEPS